MSELKPCPFCGGKPKVSFKDFRFVGKNYNGDKKVKYRVQVICNKCRSRGKPIITDALLNPNPYISVWGNIVHERDYDKLTPKSKYQTDLFGKYVAEAIEAWNRRDKDGDE